MTIVFFVEYHCLLYQAQAIPIVSKPYPKPNTGANNAETPIDEPALAPKDSGVRESPNKGASKQNQQKVANKIPTARRQNSASFVFF
jgi:hypothetical protein